MNVRTLLAAATVASALVGLASPAGAAVLRDGLDGYDGTRDTSVLILTPSGDPPVQPAANHLNYGGSTTFFSRNSSSSRSRFLIAFDASHLVGQTVQSATLTLTKGTAPVTADNVDRDLHGFEISGANADWVQGTGTGAASSDGWATGASKAHNVAGWTGGDRIGSGTTLADAVADVFSDTPYRVEHAFGTQYTLTLPAALVQSWIDSPATNAGLFFTNTGGSSQTVFISSEYTANEAFRPTLEIIMVPEPASLGVVGAAGLFLAGRRRRARPTAV